MNDLCPSIQVSEPEALYGVPDQVNNNVLRKEVRHALAPRALRVV